MADSGRRRRIRSLPPRVRSGEKTSEEATGEGLAGPPPGITGRWRPGRREPSPDQPRPVNPSEGTPEAREGLLNPLPLRRERRLLTRGAKRKEAPAQEEASYKVPKTEENDSPPPSPTPGPAPSPTPAGTPNPGPRVLRRPAPPDWEPPLAIGASLGENLSRFELAERQLLQWRAILAHNRRKQPRADLSGLESQVEEAERNLEDLEDTDENNMPVNELPSTKQAMIDDRIDLLEWGLVNGFPEAGHSNIRAAITGYQNGSIVCGDNWTLIYAGHIVDVCPSYDSFTIDRAERLDRYAEQYGAGWLWFEPPLASIRMPHLYPSTWAQPILDGFETSAFYDHWSLTMGFRRIKEYHSRPGSVAPTAQGALKTLTYTKMTITDEEDPPRCFFRTLLDSGASTPTLYQSDLHSLGIDPKKYPAQSMLWTSTANGRIRSYFYEMRVDICRHNGESLVGDDPVWPNERHELGGIVPVAVNPRGMAPPVGQRGHRTMAMLEAARLRGEDVSEEALAQLKSHPEEIRLSGILPFQVCYTASAPGKMMWFGEDRSDVLGMGKMPGQRRYERHCNTPLAIWPVQVPQETKRPLRITFEHELDDGSTAVDRDLPRAGASLLTVMDGDLTRGYNIEPRTLSSHSLPIWVGGAKPTS